MKVLPYPILINPIFDVDPVYMCIRKYPLYMLSIYFHVNYTLLSDKETALH